MGQVQSKVSQILNKSKGAWKAFFPRWRRSAPGWLTRRRWKQRTQGSVTWGEIGELSCLSCDHIPRCFCWTFQFYLGLHCGFKTCDYKSASIFFSPFSLSLSLYRNWRTEEASWMRSRTLSSIYTQFLAPLDFRLSLGNHDLDNWEPSQISFFLQSGFIWEDCGVNCIITSDATKNVFLQVYLKCSPLIISPYDTSVIEPSKEVPSSIL